MTEYYCYDAPDGHHKTCIRNTAKKIVLQRIPARGVTLPLACFLTGRGIMLKIRIYAWKNVNLNAMVLRHMSWRHSVKNA